MTDTHPPGLAEPNIDSILGWLALAHRRTGLEEAQGLLQPLRALVAMPLAMEQRLQLLDLLYAYATKITLAQLPSLPEATLPVPRRIRQLVRAIQDSLELLAQAYLNTLAGHHDHESSGQPPARLAALGRAMQCLSWHLTISHLVAAPLGAGIWQQLHSTFRTARRLGIDSAAGPKGENRIDRIYLSSLLLAVAHPSSFTSRELGFIRQYIERCIQAVDISETLPAGERDSVFWIDPDQDLPPHALARRTPPPETAVFYFACRRLALEAADHLAALENGHSAAELGLPAFAETSPGRGVLKRLNGFWGYPAKRRFPRRRQSYRADLCAGLDPLWQLLHQSEAPPATSQWMITNESPDGYAMMHVSGPIEQLRVGDILALRPRLGEIAGPAAWQVGIARWALSENPEHVELGVQVLSAGGIPARLALPREPGQTGSVAALLLPAAPPVRPMQTLITPTGAIRDLSQKLVLLVERGNLAVHELRAIRLEEQTSSIELFAVEPDSRP